MPFHFWTPDTYEGAPTPVTAFLSVASKAGGFVALLTHHPLRVLPVAGLVGAGALGAGGGVDDLGNLVALRQTNIVRMLAYSSIAQGGFILVPLAVAGDGTRPRRAFEAVLIYLFIYAAMNLGAFAVVIAVARRTRSAEIASYSGPRPDGAGARAADVDLPVLARRHPAVRRAGSPSSCMFRAVLRRRHAVGVHARRHRRASTRWSRSSTTPASPRKMWFHDPAEAGVEPSPARTPPALGVAIGLSAAVVVVIGIYPQLFARIGELAFPG